MADATSGTIQSGRSLPTERKPGLNRLGEIFAWVFLGLAVLCLVGWPIAIWRHVNNGLPIIASILETLPYPLGALFFWIVGRGLKLSLDLRQGG